MAFASQVGFDKQGNPTDDIRRHFLPLSDKHARKLDRQFHSNEDRLLITPQVVCTGNNLQSVAIALIHRRIIEAGQKNQHDFPLQSRGRITARLADIAQLLAGDLDEAKTLQLIRPMLAINWQS